MQHEILLKIVSKLYSRMIFSVWNVSRSVEYVAEKIKNGNFAADEIRAKKTTEKFVS